MMEFGTNACDDKWARLKDDLVDALTNNNFDKAKSVLNSGLDFNELMIKSKPLLRFCGEQGNRDICALLVRHGVQVNSVHGKLGYSLLHNAAASGNYGFASILLELGASPTLRTSNQSTPLHFASRKGHAYLAAKLLDHGAEVDAQDKYGRSSLMLAFQKSQFGIAKVLIKNRSSLDVPDHSGTTPRMVVESRGPPWSELFCN